MCIGMAWFLCWPDIYINCPKFNFIYRPLSNFTTPYHVWPPFNHRCSVFIFMWIKWSILINQNRIMMCNHGTVKSILQWLSSPNHVCLCVAQILGNFHWFWIKTLWLIRANSISWRHFCHFHTECLCIQQLIWNMPGV